MNGKYEINKSSKKELLRSHHPIKTVQECLDKMDKIDLICGETIIVLGQGEYEILTLEEDAILYDYPCNFMFIITGSGKYYSIDCEPAVVSYRELKEWCDDGKLWNRIKSDIEKYSIKTYIINPA